MGCFSHKSFRPLLDVPDFRVIKKEFNREDILNQIDEIFTTSKKEYVRLSLESNIFRLKRLKLKENKISDDLNIKT